MLELILQFLLILLVATALAVVLTVSVLTYQRHRESHKGERSKLQPSKLPKERQRLEKLYSLYTERHSFQAGQLVRWKPGQRNKNRPVYDQPAVVLELLDQPIRNKAEISAGSSHYREPLDIILGLVDEDDEFIAFHFDSARFEPFPDADK